MGMNEIWSPWQESNPLKIPIRSRVPIQSSLRGKVCDLYRAGSQSLTDESISESYMLDFDIFWTFVTTIKTCVDLVVQVFDVTTFGNSLL